MHYYENFVLVLPGTGVVRYAVPSVNFVPVQGFIMLDSLKDMFSRLIGVKSHHQAKQKWSSALPEEIQFWDKWLRNSGDPWPDAFSFRCDPNAPLQGDIVKALAKQPGEVAEIPDMGAGPLTFLGKQAPGLTIHITAVDPLAEQYDRLLEQYRIQPLVHKWDAPNGKKRFFPSIRSI